MKILVLSDLHLDKGAFKVPDVDYDVAVLAGDIQDPGVKGVAWARRAANFGETKPVIFVPGNHEFYGGVIETTLEEMKRAAAGTNVHLLDREEIVIGGVRFLGATLWTDFKAHIDTPQGPRSDQRRAMEAAEGKLNDYAYIRIRDPNGAVDGNGRPRKRWLRAEHTLAMHRIDRAWLEARLREPFKGRTVVVTHHAPHRGSMVARFSRDFESGAYVSELPSVFFDSTDLWIHGHIHESRSYRVDRCLVVANPRGYYRQRKTDNEHFDPRMVIEI